MFQRERERECDFIAGQIVGYTMSGKVKEVTSQRKKWCMYMFKLITYYVRYDGRRSGFWMAA